jgi:predicted amidohydrolase YtcJ
MEKSMRRSRSAGAIALGVVLLAGSVDLRVGGSRNAQAQGVPAADLVLTNGKILTVDTTDSVAQAVAVSGGKIVAVGTNEDVRVRIGAATQLIDLRGRTATPGLIDTHIHFTQTASLTSIDLGAASVKSMDDVLALVRERVAKSKPGEWIRGRGWDEGKLKERRYIYASDLDKVSPNNPVWLTHTTGHYGVGNSDALRLAKVTRETKDPPAGTIDRDAQGNPTGVMKEAANGIITRLMPPISREQQKAGILKMIDDFAKEGMTGAKDPGIDQEKWALYKEILNEGKLNTRVFALFSVGRTVEAAKVVLGHLRANASAPGSQSLGDGRLLAGGVKMIIDGSGGARTAWMYEDWHKNFHETDSGNAGYPLTEPQTYRQIARMIHDAGYHIGTHAIGDRGIDWVVDTYDQLLKTKPTKGLRHSIIHANTPTDRAIDTMARLQKEFDAAYPEASATFMWWIGDNYAGNLGPGRALRLKPFKTWQDRDIKWSGGSDFGVTPYPARYGLWASVARQTLNGVYGQTPFGLAESVDIKTALRSFTIWAAHQLFLDDRVGSIEVGKDADIAVWDRDMYTIPTDQLQNLKCEMTLVAGKVVYRADSGANTGQ